MSRWYRYEKTKDAMERDDGSTAARGVSGDLYRVKTGAGEGTEMRMRMKVRWKMRMVRMRRKSSCILVVPVVDVRFSWMHDLVGRSRTLYFLFHRAYIFLDLLSS